MSRFALVLSWAVVLIGGTQVAASPKVSPASLKDIEQKPDGYLGRRVTVEGWLGPDVKATGSTSELAVRHEEHGRAARLRFVAPKSLAEQVAAIGAPRAALFTGTVSAPESSRAGYTFEIEQIALPGADGTTTFLKPTAVAAPAEPSATASEKSEPVQAKAAVVESGKRSEKIPTVLVVVAGGLALFLLVALVVGVRLMKHLKSKAPPAKAAHAVQR